MIGSYLVVKFRAVNSAHNG